MKKEMAFSLVLILGISIGYFAKKNTTDVYTIRQYTPEYSFNKNRFKDSIWDVNDYKEYGVLEGHSDTKIFLVKLETALYEIQKKKKSAPLKSKILIQFFGNLKNLETMEIQEMVESKFHELDIVYMYLNNGATDLSVRIGFIY